MTLGGRAAGLAPWTGLWTGAAAWILHQQIGSDAVLLRCDPTDPALVATLGVVAAAAAAGGALVSWRSGRREPASGESQALRRFVGVLGTAGGALFAFAIALQTLAAVLEPPCA